MRRAATAVIAIAPALLLSACGRYGVRCGEGWDPMTGFGYFGHGGMFMGILFIAILVAAVIYMFAREAGPKGDRHRTPETPLDILKRRYAGGEISKEAYDKMKKELGG